MNNDYVLELLNISKSFPGVKALDKVTLRLRKGEVLGLCGENGAGKSTLIKIITGYYTADEGEMLANGKKVQFAYPGDAFKAGISAVHQERNLIYTFNVAENVMFEKMTNRANNIVKMKKLAEQAKKYLDMVNLNISPYSNVEDMSAAQMQILEIARALAMDAKIVLLDEPTASISIEDSKLLISIVRRLCTQGYSFIYVSHKLDEIFQVCDEVCVIRDGKNSGETKRIGEITKSELIRLMVGRTERNTKYPVRDKTANEVVLEGENLISAKNPHSASFKLHKGEILGWYGLVGSGRTELAREIIGLDPATSGTIYRDGKPVKIKNVKQALENQNIAYVSESRNEEGLFLIHSIKTNIASSSWRKISKYGFVKNKEERAIAEKYVAALEIKTPSYEQVTNNLSGGNRQKVSMAKGLATNPKILIFDEPTVGIDIKTKEDIHQLIWDLAEKGISIILISSDMPELISLADRIMVFNKGNICCELTSNKDYDPMSEKIMTAIVQNN